MRRLSASVAIVVAAGLVLAGCTTGDAYPRETASRLQHAVLEVATSASTNDYATALTKLADLEQINDAAAKKGSITSARHDAIAKSIATVRSDLTGLQAAAERRALEAQIQQLQQQQQQQGGKHDGPGGGPKKNPKGDG